MKTIASFISIFLLSIIMMGAGVPKTVSGIVSDENGYAIIGASIIEKGTTNGTVTDLYGRYTLSLTTTNPVLVVSYIGMETQEVKVGQLTTLNITMQTSTQELDEVVVVAYGISKTESVGSVAPGIRIRGSASYDKKARQNYAAAPVACYEQEQNWNTEGYASISENGFKDVKHNPLSTFSIDVDKASYSNVRRFINNGQMPPVDAVRIEEMVNYFSYDYPEPDGEHPFTVSTELSTCP